MICGTLVLQTCLEEDHQRVWALLHMSVTARDKRMWTGCTPQLTTQLETYGVTQGTDAGAESVLEQSTDGRIDRIEHPQTHRLVHARVGASGAR